MDCPVQWSLATPSALESQSRANQGSVVANPICKCRRHKAGHLQVRVAVGKRSTVCVLKEAPLNKGPLGLPHMLRAALKGTELRYRESPKRQTFADSPLLLETQAFGGRRKRQKTADFRRKPKIFAENRRKAQIGLRHLRRSVTLSSALMMNITSPILGLVYNLWFS